MLECGLQDNCEKGGRDIQMSALEYKLSTLAREMLVRSRWCVWRLLYGWRYLEAGPGAMIVRPIKITPRCIRIKRKAFIYFHGRVQGIRAYQGTKYTPEIIFDEGASAQQNLHLTCARKVYIGKNTAIAANVTITDIIHQYEDVNRPVEWQPLQVFPVHIGKDCKIYNNVVILPGTVIGDHCVVGANAVVSGTFESFTVIVGVPARVVKKYDKESGTWVKVPSEITR